MKKLFGILFVLALCSTLLALSSPLMAADTWYQANQRTLAWDPVSEYVEDDGTHKPFPTGDIIKYRCYFRLAPGGTGSVPSDPVFAAENAETRYTFTFPAEGDYHLGVETIRFPKDLPDGEAPLVSTAVAWSNDPTYAANGEPFGVRYYSPPATARGLRVE
jgi:hypothetical protein